MSSHLSIAEVLSRLEAQIASVREKEAFHAQHEAFHRDQRTALAARLEDLTRRYEAFKASATEAVDVAAAVGEASEGNEDPGGGKGRPKLPHLVNRVIEGLETNQHFGPAWVAREINRRFGKRLRKPANHRLVSIVLRRMADKGQLHIYRSGRPHQETRYVRGKAEGA